MLEISKHEKSGGQFALASPSKLWGDSSPVSSLRDFRPCLLESVCLADAEGPFTDRQMQPSSSPIAADTTQQYNSGNYYYLR